MVLRGRIELPTSSLPMMCSTTELPQHPVECGGLCHKRGDCASMVGLHFSNCLFRKCAVNGFRNTLRGHSKPARISDRRSEHEKSHAQRRNERRTPKGKAWRGAAKQPSASQSAQQSRQARRRWRFAFAGKSRLNRFGCAG